MMLLALIALFLFILGVLLVFVICSDIELPDSRNYEVRFSAQNNKYYVINKVLGKEKRVTGRFGFTIYYDDRITADMICQKLNNVE